MIAEHICREMSAQRRRGLIFAAGGSADLVLAKTISEGLIAKGVGRIDLAQPLNCQRLSEKDLRGKAGVRHALSPESSLDPELILRHHASVPRKSHADIRRGKGLSISASLDWAHGTRYVLAAHGGGPAALAGRLFEGQPFYDFALGVDGGGDVLTHDEEEFDRVVVAGVRAGWHASLPLFLVVMGLGADGGSEPTEFDGATLQGWRALVTAGVDQGFADKLERQLDQLGLWHLAPSTWTPDDAFWGYGFKVPQIIALATRGVFPFDGPTNQPELVWFPRRRQLKLMDRRLLSEVRVFVSEVPR